MRTEKIRTVAVVFVASVAMLCAVASAAAKPFRELVPEDVSAFGSLRDYTAFVQKLKATPYASFLEEPEVKAFIQQIVDLAGEEWKEAREQWEQAGTTAAEIGGVLSGEIAFAQRQKLVFTPMAPAPPQTAMLLLADVGENVEEAARLIDRLVELAAQQEQVQLADEEFNGHKIRHLTIQDETAGGEAGMEELEGLDPELQEALREMQAELGEDAAQAPGFHVHISLEGGIAALSFGTSRKLLEEHLLLRDGQGSGALADSELFKRTMAQVDLDGDYVTFQSFRPMRELLMQMGAMVSHQVDFEIESLFEALGIFGLEAQGSSARLVEGGVSTVSFLLAPAPRRGIMKAFVPTEGANVRPPRFVGDDVGVYVGAYFDVPTLWAEIKGILRDFAPPQHAMLEMMLNAPGVPIRLEADVINNVGSHWFLYVPREVVDPGPPMTIHAVLAVALKDSEAVERAFNTALQLVEMRQQAFRAAMAAAATPEGEAEPGDVSLVEKIPFMDKTIYQTLPISVLEGIGGPSLPPINMVFVDGKFIIATSEAMAKKAIQYSAEYEASPLLSQREFRAALRQMTSAPEGIVYADSRVLGRWFYDLAQFGLQRVTQFDPSNPVADLQLPSFETLEKYLYVSASTWKWNDEGVLSTCWQPHPPE